MYTFRVSENMVLRIFGSKKEELEGGWRRVNKEGRHN
jgi:hypothetical protein